MKTLPKFKDQSEEMVFWEQNDVTDFFDTKKAKIVRFTNLKKSTKTISLRLPDWCLNQIPVSTYIKSNLILIFSCYNQCS